MKQLRKRKYILFPSTLCPGRTYKLTTKGRIWITDLCDHGQYRSYLCLQTAVARLNDPQSNWDRLMAYGVKWETAAKNNGSEPDMVNKVLLIKHGELQLVASSPIQGDGQGVSDMAVAFRDCARARIREGRSESTQPLAREMQTGVTKLKTEESLRRFFSTGKWVTQLPVWRIDPILG